MAEVPSQNGEGSQKELNLGSAGDCERRHCRDDLFKNGRVNNSLRGAALSLCMSVDELLELLEKHERNKCERPEKYEESPVEKTSRLLEEISELKTENFALKQEISSLEMEVRKYKKAFVVWF